MPGVLIPEPCPITSLPAVGPSAGHPTEQPGIALCLSFQELTTFAMIYLTAETGLIHHHLLFTVVEKENCCRREEVRQGGRE